MCAIRRHAHCTTGSSDSPSVTLCKTHTQKGSLCAGVAQQPRGLASGIPRTTTLMRVSVAVTFWCHRSIADCGSGKSVRAQGGVSQAQGGDRNDNRTAAVQVLIPQHGVWSCECSTLVLRGVVCICVCLRACANRRERATDMRRMHDVALGPTRCGTVTWRALLCGSVGPRNSAGVSSAAGQAVSFFREAGADCITSLGVAAGRCHLPAATSGLGELVRDISCV